MPFRLSDMTVNKNILITLSSLDRDNLNNDFVIPEPV